MGYTKRFDEIGAGDVAESGGKGANLGELTRAGLPVPPGFVVTTAAYDEFVAAHDLAATIAAPAMPSGSTPATNSARISAAAASNAAVSSSAGRAASAAIVVSA